MSTPSPRKTRRSVEISSSAIVCRIKELDEAIANDRKALTVSEDKERIKNSIAESQEEMSRLVLELDLDKKQIHKISSKLKSFKDRVKKGEQEIKDLETKTKLPVKELKKHFKKAERGDARFAQCRQVSSRVSGRPQGDEPGSEELRQEGKASRAGGRDDGPPY